MPIVNWTAAFQASPAGTDTMDTVDDKIRELKEQISLRWEQGGHANTRDPNSVGHSIPANDAHDGRHVVDAGGSGVGPDIWKSDMSGRTVIWSDTACTAQSGITWVGENVTTGSNPGHEHDTTMVVYLPQTTTGRVTGVMYHNLGNGTLYLQEAVVRCWTAPGAATLTVDIHRLDNTYTDPAATSTPPDDDTIFSTPPVVGNGNFVSAASVINTGGSMEELAVGEAWVFEIDTNDTADDIFVILKVRRG